MRIGYLSVFYIAAALVAFAGNSVLCRVALHGQLIDPASFTAVRILSGAVFLIVLVRPSLSLGGVSINAAAKLLPSVCLFVYALSFSYAYIDLSTGAGALILFGVVQLTMLMLGVIKEGKPAFTDIFGMTVAVLGLCYLLLPGEGAPSLRGLVLMGISGVAWAVYSYLGRGAPAPVTLTAQNFIFATPMALVMFALSISSSHITSEGLLLACISGVVTSGLGYILWYMALNYVSLIQAAVLQLLVPIIATLGGVIFVSEAISLQLILSSLLVLGGVALTIFTRRPKPTQ